jgi:Uma2 family endonuclease
MAEALLTAEEYARLPDSDVPTELVRGRVVPLRFTTPRHGQICASVVGILYPPVEDGDLGQLVCNDSGVVTERNPDTVRGADVAYYSFARIPKGPLPGGYLVLVPELIFEVIAPESPWPDVRAKTQEYLDAGVTTVCVLDPMQESVHVFNNDAPNRIFTADQELTLPEVLGDFRAPVRLFFE